MIQGRMQKGDDKRWYCPDRDICWAFPKLISAALHSRLQHGIGSLTQEQMGQQCKKLAQLCNQCRDLAISPEALLVELQALDPDFRAAVSDAFFLTFFGTFRVWCADVFPKEPQDSRIDMSDIEKVMKDFANGARNDETTAG